MSIIDRLFGKKEKPMGTYKDFWNWFNANGLNFYSTIESGIDIEKDFFNKLSPKLEEINEGFYYLAGMYNDNTAELVLTADGNVKNIVLVEELVNAAPAIAQWKFTALKPALGIEDVNINMAGYTFKKDNLGFYANELTDYPDEIDIVITYDDYREVDKDSILNGIYIFLDNFLGELNSVTIIDNLTVIGTELAGKEVIPIAKLKEYLIWRENEFVEENCGTWYNTDNDVYATFEANLPDGQPLIAIINTSLLEWESKASHPWVLEVEIRYQGNDNGMPNNSTYELMDRFEDEIMAELKDFDGFLSIGRQTAGNVRTIYFVCKEFRKPSKVLFDFSKKYLGMLDISFDIYKDKYWRSFRRFMPKM